MLGAPSQLIAEDIIFENFENQPETRWRFFADTVMGGVSTGQVEFKIEGGESYGRDHDAEIDIQEISFY